jgi:hypothetical protein
MTKPDWTQRNDTMVRARRGATEMSNNYGKIGTRRGANAYLWAFKPLYVFGYSVQSFMPWLSSLEQISRIIQGITYCCVKLFWQYPCGTFPEENFSLSDPRYLQKRSTL